MRVVSLILLLFIVSCSHSPLNRGPSSIETDFHYGEIDLSKSSVKVFPPDIDKTSFKYYFYLELKDSQGKFVDVDSNEIELKLSKGKKVPFKLDRVLRGRYYLTLDEKPSEEETKLNLYVRKLKLKQNVKLFLKKADRNKSWIKAVRAERFGLKLRLFLGDSKGKPVELPSTPEIILNGLGHVENLEHLGEGIWEFDLVFPNANQLIYVSVRAHGKFLPDMFRVQHIEK